MDASALLVRRRPDPATETVGRGLGVASLGIGVAGLVAPRLMGRVMRLERSAVWVIAVRDLASAWLILGKGGRIAYLTRGLFDMSDAVLMSRRRPLLALLALVTGLVGLTAGMAADD